jgi:uncharacterized membrane protein
MKTLTAAAIAWPLLLASVVWARQGGHAPLWTTAVYLVGSKICHQLADRSFHTNGVQWPVCARCAGLYLAAPIGAVAAIAARRRPRAWGTASWPILIVAAVPTMVTLAIEWPGIGAPSNLMRALAALPLGAAIAFLIVRAASGRRGAIR